MAGESQKEPTTGTPDPSVLTTESLQREVEALKDLIDLKVDGLKSVVDEKFESVTTQLQLIERQRVEQKKDTKDAVDAALQAAKEAVKEQTTASDRAIAKSESATAEQAKTQTATTTAAVAGVVSNLDDLKERVGKIENIKLGGNEERAAAEAARNAAYAARNAAYGAVGCVLALLLIGGILFAAWPR